MIETLINDRNQTRRQMLGTSAAALASSLLTGCNSTEQVAKKEIHAPEKSTDYDFSKHPVIKLEQKFFPQKDWKQVFKQLNEIRDQFLVALKHHNLLDNKKKEFPEAHAAMNLFFDTLRTLDYTRIEDNGGLFSDTILKKGLECDNGSLLTKIIFDSIPELKVPIALVHTNVTSSNNNTSGHCFMRYDTQEQRPTATGSQTYANWEFDLDPEVANRLLDDDFYASEFTSRGLSNKESQEAGYMVPLREQDIGQIEYNNICNQFFVMNDLEACKKATQEARTAFPNSTVLLSIELHRLLEEQKYQEVIDQAQKYSNINHEGIIEALTYAYQHTEGLAKARKFIDKKIQEKPQFHELYRIRAGVNFPETKLELSLTERDLSTYFKLNNKEISDENLKLALSEELTMLAMIHLQKAEQEQDASIFPKILITLKRSIELNPNNSDALFFKGYILGILNDDSQFYKEALADLNKAMKLAPSTQGYIYLSEMHFRMGDITQSRTTAQEALKLATSDGDSASIEVLKQLLLRLK